VTGIRSVVRWPARHALACALYASAALLVALRETDRILRATHGPGEGSYGVGSLTPVLHPHTDATFARAVVSSWKHGAQPIPGVSFSGPLDVAAVYLVLDLAFILAYAVVLGILVVRARRRLADVAPQHEVAIELRLLRLALGAVVALAAVDVLEDAVQAALVRCGAEISCWPGEWVAILGWLFTLAKWGLLVVGVALPLLLAAIEIGRRAPVKGARASTRALELWRGVLLLRVEIFLVAFFGLALFAPLGSDQFADVIRRWNAGVGFGTAWAAIGFVVVFSAVIGATSWLHVAALARGPVAAGGATPPRAPSLLAVALAGAGLAVLGGLGWWRWDAGMGIFGLGALLLALVALSVPVRSAAPIGPPVWEHVNPVPVRPFVVGLPLALLGLAMLAASLPEVISARHWAYAWLIAGGLLVQAAGWMAYGIVRRTWQGKGPKRDELVQRSAPAARLIVALALLLLVVTIVLVVLNPLATGDALGTIAVFGIWLAGTAAVGYVLLRAETRFAPLPFFRVLGLSRTPLFAVVIVWAVLASALDTGGYHDIRTLGVGQRPSTESVTLFSVPVRGGHTIGAWDRWVGEHPLLARGHAPDAKGRRFAVPLIFVAAEGGGIRAAYWTARVLDCALDRGSGCAGGGAQGTRALVFAASGASGGSLGLVTYYTHSLASRHGRDWVDARLGGDYLAPTWAWTTFVDLPNALLRLNAGQDRAAVLERSWEQSWTKEDTSFSDFSWHHPSRGALATRALLRSYLDGRNRLPLLLLSGTSVGDGCRINNSVLNGDVESTAAKDQLARDCLATGPFEANGSSPADAVRWTFAATHDLVDVLCPDRDVRMSTAALLSARFPYISPSGRIGRCHHPSWSVSTVDGGYFDNSGASPLVELWARLAPAVRKFNITHDGACIVPMYLQIDNYYKGASTVRTEARVAQAFVPPATFLAIWTGREANARQAAAIEFSQRNEFRATLSPGGNRPQIVPRYAHVYPRVHPGTEAPLGWLLSEASMRDLTQQLRDPGNVAELAKVRAWLDPRLRCGG